MRDLLPHIEQLPWTYALPVLSLFICLLAVVGWAYRRSSGELFREMAKLPLDDEGAVIRRRE